MKVRARVLAGTTESASYIQDKHQIFGEPILLHLLKEIKRADFIDEIFVLTKDDAVAEIARTCMCHVVPVVDQPIDFKGGFFDIHSNMYLANDYIRTRYGNIPEIAVYLNSNYCLITAEILEKMFVKLMEDRIADSIVPVTRIAPHLFMENSKTGSFFPFWQHSSLDRQDYPDVYRSGGIRMIHPRRVVSSHGQRVIFQVVEQEYLLNVDSLEKARLAEYYLMRRMDGRVVLPEHHDKSPNL